MAVTIASNPASLCAAYNPIVYTVTSTNYAQTNFKFIADIYLNASPNPLPRMKFPAVPGQNYQAIDIGGIVKNYLSRNPYIIGESKFKTDDNSILSVVVQFGEEYGPSSGVTTYVNLTATSGVAVINASLAYPDFVTGLTASYSTGGTGKKFLTNDPRISNVLTINNIGASESYWLYFTNPAQAAAIKHDYLQIQAFDVDGNLLQQSLLANPYTTPSAINEKHLRVGVGTYELGLLTTPDLFLGAAPVLPAGTSYYEVNLCTLSANTSEVARLYVTSKCSKASTTYRLVWLNAFGGYDSFTFYGQQQRTSSIERKTYKKYAGYFNSGIFTYDNQNSRQNAQFNTVVKDSYRITSDWITEAESTWLEDLITSPDVYYVSGTELIPINITDSGYVFKTVSRDQIFNLELTFTPCFERMRQQW